MSIKFGVMFYYTIMFYFYHIFAKYEDPTYIISAKKNARTFDFLTVFLSNFTIFTTIIFSWIFEPLYQV